MIPAIYTWDARDSEYFCLPQTTVSGEPLLLNGHGNTGISSNPASGISFGNVSRTVSVSSSGDPMGATITIVGTLFNRTQTDTINIPNNDIDYTNLLFDSVTSVTTNADVNVNISVGSGKTGRTHFFNFNYNCKYPSLSVDVNVTSNNITYDFIYTNLDPSIYNPIYNSGIVVPYPNQAEAFNLKMNNATATDFAYFNFPIGFCAIEIIDSDENGSLISSFIQQGIR